MDASDRELFARSLRQATINHTGAALDTALEELGWHDALAVDSRLAVSVLFELQGNANSTSSALDHVLLSGLGVAHPATVGVVLPAPGCSSPPGDLDGARVTIRGLGTTALLSRETALVVATSAGKTMAMTIDTAELALRPVHGLDAGLGLVEVTGETAATRSGPVDWGAAVGVAQLAVGHEVVGAAKHMLELARQHALDRIQFGRPISMFQAVRHRLAETLVAIEGADALLGAAWEDRSPQTAMMAKALAGRAGRTAARHCQQVLGGIGFTTEHPLHHYIRRVLVLDAMLGTACTLTTHLGNELLRVRQLPALLPL